MISSLTFILQTLACFLIAFFAEKMVISAVRIRSADDSSSYGAEMKGQSLMDPVVDADIGGETLAELRTSVEALREQMLHDGIGINDEDFDVQ